MIQFSFRLAIVFVAVAISIGLEIYFESVLGRTQPLLFLWPVVMVAARYSFWLGIGAILISVLAAVYTYLDPRYAFAVSNLQEWLWLSIFIALGIGLCFWLRAPASTIDLSRPELLEHSVAETSNHLAHTLSWGKNRGRSFPGPREELLPSHRLLEPLGRGGFGEVWKALGPGGRLLALKFVPWIGRLADLEIRGMEIVKNVRHPHLLRVFDTWVTDESFIISMELADSTLLERWRAGIGKVKLLEFFAQAAAGIDYLHSQGIHHRDIKPQNFLLLDGKLKVADFGLVRIMEHTVSGHTGNLTVAYAAPEFFEGHTCQNSDQYCLAVTYCHMRGNRLPFTGTAAQMVHGHLHRQPDLSMLPEEERPAVARALSKNPQDRWPSCGAFVDAL
jgi:hypothetical protein